MAELKILEEISSYDNEDKIVSVLEANHSLIVTVDQDGKNIIHFAAEKGLRNVIAFVISYLTRTNGEALKNMFNPDKFGNTPLHYACMSNSVETIKDIADFSPDKNALNQEHRTPFFISSIRCGMTVLDYCLNAFKPDVQLTDVRGANVLHWAVREGNEEKISYLMDIGVNINAPALDNRTPCDVPSKNPSLRPDDGILKTMKEKQEIIKLAFKAIKNGSTDIKLAFSYEKYLDEYGCTLLHQCAKCNNLAIAERFVQYIHNNDKDIFGRTPLRCAIVYESSPALTQLFKDNQGVSFELREPNIKGEEANHVQFTNTSSSSSATTTGNTNTGGTTASNTMPMNNNGNVLPSNNSIPQQQQQQQQQQQPQSAYIDPMINQSIIRNNNNNPTSNQQQQQPTVNITPLQTQPSVPMSNNNNNNNNNNNLNMMQNQGVSSPSNSSVNKIVTNGSQSPLHQSQPQQQQQQNIVQNIPVSNTQPIQRVPSQQMQTVIPPIQQQQQQQQNNQLSLSSSAPLPQQQQPIQQHQQPIQQPIQPPQPIQQQQQPSIPPLNMQMPIIQQPQITPNSSQTIQLQPQQLQQQPSSQDPSQLTQMPLSPSPMPQPSPSTNTANTLSPPQAPKLSTSSEISPPNNSTATTTSSITSRLTAEEDVKLIDTVRQFLTSIDLQSYIDILEQNGIYWVAQLIEQKENLQNYITKEGHLREVKKYLTNLPGFNDPVPSFLKQHNLSNYTNAFKDAKIDTSLRLNLLKDCDLEKIGVKKGHRKDILHNITPPNPNQNPMNLSSMEYDLFLAILRISPSKNALIENGYDKIPLLANLDDETCLKYGIKLGDFRQIEYELGDIIKQKKDEETVEKESEPPSPSPTVDLRKVSIDNGLGDYIDTLLENGYDTLERIKDISKSDLEDMGIEDEYFDDILNKIQNLTPKRISKSAILSST